MKRSEFDGKVVLVTGSSRGIGAAIAKAFAVEGAKVALHGRDESALSSVERAIKTAGGVCKQFICELTSFKEIENMRIGIEATFGTVEILVANAGGNYTPPATLEEIPEDGWQQTVDANLSATYLTIKSFLPSMKLHKSGSIITMASAAARMPNAMS